MLFSLGEMSFRLFEVRMTFGLGLCLFEIASNLLSDGLIALCFLISPLILASQCRFCLLECIFCCPFLLRKCRIVMSVNLTSSRLIFLSISMVFLRYRQRFVAIEDCYQNALSCHYCYLRFHIDF